MRALLCLFLVTLSSIATADIPITGGDGATVKDLILEEALVTLTVKTSGKVGKISNVRILSINDATITVTEAAGDPSPYPVSMVTNIKVQSGRVKRTQMVVQRLTEDDLVIVDQADRKAKQIYDQIRDQRVRMRAAALRAVMGDESAMQYLRDLLEQNDAAISVDAAGYLYLAGDDIDDSLLAKGFASGNRSARAMAAKLAGLYGRERFMLDVRDLLTDPTKAVFIEAAKASGRLGDRKALPHLYRGLEKLDREEGLAAAYAISLIGGDDVKEELRSKLKVTRGETWYRVLYTLHLLGDENARNTLREEALHQPVFGVDVALLLADEDEWEGTEYLRAFLEKRMDPNRENLEAKARVAAQLFKDGMLQAKVELQNLVHIKPGEIYAKNYQTGASEGEAYKKEVIDNTQRAIALLVGDVGDTAMLSLLPPIINSKNPEVSLTACAAAISIGELEFSERLRAYLK